MTVINTTVTVGRSDATGNDDDSETITVMTTTVMVRTMATDYDGDMIVIKMLVIDLIPLMNGSRPIDKDCMCVLPPPNTKSHITVIHMLRNYRCSDISAQLLLSVAHFSRHLQPRQAREKAPVKIWDCVCSSNAKGTKGMHIFESTAQHVSAGTWETHEKHVLRVPF